MVGIIMIKAGVMCFKFFILIGKALIFSFILLFLKFLYYPPPLLFFYLIFFSPKSIFEYFYLLHFINKFFCNKLIELHFHFAVRWRGATCIPEMVGCCMILNLSKIMTLIKQYDDKFAIMLYAFKCQ